MERKEHDIIVKLNYLGYPHLLTVHSQKISLVLVCEYMDFSVFLNKKYKCVDNPISGKENYPSARLRGYNRMNNLVVTTTKIISKELYGQL